MKRQVAAALVLVLFAACQSQTHAVFSPEPSPTPHMAPTAAVLQAADVPPGLNVCLGSGPIDVYVTTIGASNATVAASVASEWQQLQSAGAGSAAISIYSSTAAACSAELGATSSARSAAGFVAEFGDAGEADRAWAAGVFGFSPPASGEVAPEVSRGVSTGLGLSSFTYIRGPVRLASWRRSVFVAVVVTTNLDPASFSAATAAVDARLN